jgi:hypothetical protein
MSDSEDVAVSEDANAALWKSDIGVSFWKTRDDFVIYGGRRPLGA